jgi:isoamylase
MRSVIVDPDTYDWEGDVPLRRAFARTVIYEMHVQETSSKRNPARASEIAASILANGRAV